MEVVPRKRRPYSTLEKLEMKKTLVALAALAATGAFAQVTLSGNLDVAYSSVGFDGLNIGTSTVQRKAQTVGSYATASTSMIILNATEDLGGGLKTTGYVEIDPRASMGDGGAFAFHSRWVGISGDFGAIKMGAIDSAAVIANGQQSPLGTGVGSGYSILQSTVFAATRYNRAVKWESNVYNGLSGSVYYAPGVQPNGTVAVEYSGLPLQRKTIELGLAYTNGPLATSLVNIQTGSSDAATAGFTNTTPLVATSATSSTSTTLLTASYSLGANNFYFGFNKGQTLGTAASSSYVYYAPATSAGLDTKGTRLGYKYTAGAYDFIAQTGKQQIGNAIPATAYTTRKVTGFRVVNNISKTSAVYAGFEGYTSGTDLAANNVSSADGGKYTILSVGIKKAF